MRIFNILSFFLLIAFCFLSNRVNLTPTMKTQERNELEKMAREREGKKLNETKNQLQAEDNKAREKK